MHVFELRGMLEFKVVHRLWCRPGHLSSGVRALNALAVAASYLFRCDFVTFSCFLPLHLVGTGGIVLPWSLSRQRQSRREGPPDLERCFC